MTCPDGAGQTSGNMALERRVRAKDSCPVWGILKSAFQTVNRRRSILLYVSFRAYLRGTQVYSTISESADARQKKDPARDVPGSLSS